MEVKPTGPDKLDEEVSRKSELKLRGSVTGKIEVPLVKARSWEDGKQLWGPGGEEGFGKIS